MDVILAPSAGTLIILIAIVLFALDRIDEWRKREERKTELLEKIAEEKE